MTKDHATTRILIDGYGAPPGLLADRIHLTRALLEWQAAATPKAISVPRVVSPGPLARNEPDSVAGEVSLGNTHIGFHTYPSRGFVTVDLHFAATASDSGEVIARLRAIFGIVETEVFVQPLGPRPHFPPHMALVG